MLRIRVPYIGEKSVITEGQDMKWPQVCGCCGQPNEGGAYQLKHRARESSLSDGNAAGLLFAWMTSGIDMSWQVPCCPACQVHSRKSRNPLRLKWTIVYAGILTMFLGGFALWSMGIANGDDFSDDPAGTAIAIAFVCLNFVAWYVVWRLVGGLMRWRGRGSMTPGCPDSLAPVTANSDAEFVRLDFTNDAYAQSVAKANGLATEPARLAKVPVMLGDLLIRLGL